MGRQPNGRPSVYLGADGWWHCYVTVGKKPNGQLDRRHLRGRTATAVADKVELLEQKLRGGHTPEVGASPTVATWLEHWLTVIAPGRVRASTLQGYESKVRHRLIPGLGGHRLGRLTPEHVETYLAGLRREVAPATALQLFRILSRALKVAVQRGKLARNPCDLIDPPTAVRDEVKPLSGADTRKVLQAASSPRWAIALALGLRQGEALGLQWEYVDLDSAVPHLRIRWALARQKWRHGCSAPTACGRKPAACPDRHGGGLALVEVKSRKSRRTLPLSPGMVRLMKDHRAVQRKARLAAPHWAGDFVFCGPAGQPVDPRRDWGAWKALLAAAGVRDARLHDARHSAGTAMRRMGMDLREVMEWLGHSQISVTSIYAHVPDEEMRERAAQLDAVHLLQPDGATTRRRRSS